MASFVLLEVNNNADRLFQMGADDEDDAAAWKAYAKAAKKKGQDAKMATFRLDRQMCYLLGEGGLKDLQPHWLELYPVGHGLEFPKLTAEHLPPWSHRRCLHWVIDRCTVDQSAAEWLMTKTRTIVKNDPSHIYARASTRAIDKAGVRPVMVMLTVPINVWRGCGWVCHGSRYSVSYALLSLLNNQGLLSE